MIADYAPDGNLLAVNYGPGSEGPEPDAFSIDAGISLATVEGEGDTVAELSVWIQNRELSEHGNLVAPTWRVTVELTQADLLVLIGEMTNLVAPHLKAEPGDIAAAIRKLP